MHGNTRFQAPFSFSYYNYSVSESKSSLRQQFWSPCFIFCDTRLSFSLKQWVQSLGTRARHGQNAGHEVILQGTHIAGQYAIVGALIFDHSNLPAHSWMCNIFVDHDSLQNFRVLYGPSRNLLYSSITLDIDFPLVATAAFNRNNFHSTQSHFTSQVHPNKILYTAHGNSSLNHTHHFLMNLVPMVLFTIFFICSLSSTFTLTLNKQIYFMRLAACSTGIYGWNAGVCEATSGP